MQFSVLSYCDFMFYCAIDVMESKWTIHARAAKVEFRILKSGEGATAYERDWKAACVSFSSKNIKHVMTVEYNYGKRIDILVSIYL